MKGHSKSPKTPRLEPYHRMVYGYIQDTRWWNLTFLQGCSWCILQPQPTRQSILASANPGYANTEHNGRKDEINSFFHTQKQFIHNVYIQVVWKRIHTRLPTDKICTECFMIKQYIKGERNMEKVIRDDRPHNANSRKTRQCIYYQKYCSKRDRAWASQIVT